jgi:cytoskeletal protein CcmA (bactofilin family)
VPASYPSGIKAFPTYANGDQVTPTTINDPNLEVTAIEAGLIDGLAHDLVPDATSNQRSLGTAGQQWYDLVISHHLTAGELTITANVSGEAAFTVINTHAAGSGAIIQGASAGAGAALRVRDYLGTDIAIITGAGQLQIDAILSHGDIKSESTLHVTGAATFSGGAAFSGGLATSGMAQLENVSITGAISVNGTATFNSPVLVHSTLTVEGTITAPAIAVSGTRPGAYAMTLTNTAATGHGLLVQAGTSSEDLLRLSNAAGVARMIIGAVGNLQVFDVLVHQGLIVTGASDLGQTVTVRRDIVSDRPYIVVGTAPVTIHTLAPRHGFDVATCLLVSGILAGNGDVSFIDLVLAIGNGSASLLAGLSKGGAGSRVYTVSGNNIQLVMGNGNYQIGTLPLTVECLGSAAVLLPTLPGPTPREP